MTQILSFVKVDQQNSFGHPLLEDHLHKKINCEWLLYSISNNFRQSQNRCMYDTCRFLSHSFSRIKNVICQNIIAPSFAQLQTY